MSFFRAPTLLPTLSLPSNLVSRCLYHGVVELLYHCVTVSLCHCVTVSLCHCVTVSLNHRRGLYCCIICPLSHFITVSLSHCATLSLWHCSLCHWVIVSVSLCQCHRRAPCHCLTVWVPGCARPPPEPLLHPLSEDHIKVAFEPAEVDWTYKRGDVVWQPEHYCVYDACREANASITAEEGAPRQHSDTVTQ